jgi:hypothetical protein
VKTTIFIEFSLLSRHKTEKRAIFPFPPCLLGQTPQIGRNGGPDPLFIDKLGFHHKTHYLLWNFMEINGFIDFY